MKTTIVFLLAAQLLAGAAEWVNIFDTVTAQVKPGYAGPTAGWWWIEFLEMSSWW